MNRFFWLQNQNENEPTHKCVTSVNPRICAYQSYKAVMVIDKSWRANKIVSINWGECGWYFFGWRFLKVLPQMCSSPLDGEDEASETSRDLEKSARRKKVETLRRVLEIRRGKWRGREARGMRGMSRSKKERRREKVSLQFSLQHSPCLQNLVSSAPSRCEIRADKLAVSLKETLKYTRRKKQNHDARI